MRFDRIDEKGPRYSRYQQSARSQKIRLILYALALVVVAAVMFSLHGKGESIAWVPTMEEALAQAKAENKPVLVYFYEPGNAACDTMDRTFTDATVRDETKAFVCVALEGPAHIDLVHRYLRLLDYDMTVYPAIVFLSPEGERLAVVLDHRSPEELIEEMRGVPQPPPKEEDTTTPAAPSPVDDLIESPDLAPRNAEPSRGETE